MKHVSDNPSETADTIRRDIYVDNILTSVNTEDDARKFFHESRKLLSDAGVNLRSWASNSTVLQETAKTEAVIDQDLETKILGMRWDPEQDILTFAKKISNTESRFISKREILRQSSSIFDPLGLLGPVTIRAKLLMQQLWKQKLSWDEILPEHIHSEWIDMSRDIQSALGEIKLPRHFFNESTQNHPFTLHVFVDASEKAYGACVYIYNGENATLIIAKNRVAPLKNITLPRLELMAAVIGARLANNVQQSICIDFDSVTYWSDSQVVLHWLSSSKSLNKFVEKRKSEILKLTAPHLWKYVPTDTNPADLQTRGLSAEQLKTSALWWHGPKWLNNKDQWPVWEPQNRTVLLEVDTDVDEILTSASVNATGIHRIVDITRFNTLHTLLRVSAYVLRFISNCKIHEENIRTILSEIETVINDRPLTYVSSEIQDLQPLTPSHLLYGRMKTAPSVSVSQENTNITHTEANKQLERKELVLQHFLKRWRMEYLTGLREFHKFSGKNDTKIKVGDIVQVYENMPRTKWKLAMIDELITGNDGLVRAAKIHTASNKITTRPVTKLYPLELP
ncbi:uncharacterized protein LOC130050470 [Ostrea edulis]|uniref:uncharacterized protein LOC130050470 n=1 Tax=Ostrea edulis TaxID=37623 RepID=UPI0024AED90E|nr:uncharacterized protein LOC130050470 [Ostrea edulis]